MKTTNLVRQGLGLLFMLASLFSSSVYAQSHNVSAHVLSSSGTPLNFELPLSSSLLEELTPQSTARLATPAQHTANGMLYPTWLTDASFVVRNRPGQRLALVVFAKRDNPELMTELIVTINNQGRRSFHPLHVMFDAVGKSNGEALPDTPTYTAAPANTEIDTKPVVNVPVIRFDEEPAPNLTPKAAIATPVPSIAPDLNRQSIRSTALRPRSTSMQSAATTQAPIATQKTPMPAADSPASAPSVPISATPLTTPEPRTTKLSPPPPPPLQTWPDLLWDNIILIAGGLLLLLLTLYLTNRGLKKWRAHRAEQVQSGFLEPKPTQLAPEETGLNTVFGLSEEEANAMHAKWLREQTERRNT